jgi:hypothetical protein
VFVAVGALVSVAAPAAGTTTGAGGVCFCLPAGLFVGCADWLVCASISAIFSISAARAAAWAGLSAACTEIKPALRTTAHIAATNLEICIPFFYANLPSEATAFPWAGR